MIRVVLAIHALYYLLTGLWPVVSMATFEQVTGPKTDDWLVRMVGLLAASIGAALGVAAWRGDPSREILVLAGCSILSFTAIDAVYVALGTISPIYLADAAVELALLVAYLACFMGARRRKG